MSVNKTVREYDMLHKFMLGFSMIVSGFVLLSSCSTESGTHVVHTNTGKQITLTNFQAGTFHLVKEGGRVQYGVDSAGNPNYHSESQYEFTPGTDVKLKVGDAFGFRFSVPPLGTTDSVVIEIETVLPKKIIVDGKEQTVVKWKTTIKNQNDESIIHTFFWTFRPENPHYHLTGLWKYRLFNGEQSLETYSFNVVN